MLYLMILIQCEIKSKNIKTYALTVYKVFILCPVIDI